MACNQIVCFLCHFVILFRLFLTYFCLTYIFLPQLSWTTIEHSPTIISLVWLFFHCGCVLLNCHKRVTKVGLICFVLSCVFYASKLVIEELLNCLVALVYQVILLFYLFCLDAHIWLFCFYIIFCIAWTFLNVILEPVETLHLECKLKWF